VTATLAGSPGATSITTVPVPRHTSDDLQWLSPSPLWQAGDLAGAAHQGRTAIGAGAGSAVVTPTTIVQPWISELTVDQFMARFLALCAGTDGVGPADLAGTRPALAAGGGDATNSDATYRLFQPLSRRYYVVTASLCCRRPGLPDHQLDPGEEEQAFFVMRRVDDAGEYGHVGAAWLPADANTLLDGEKRFPVHATPVAGFAAPGTPAAALGMAAGAPSTRQLLYGYIPVASRDELVPPLADPGGELKKVQDSMSLPNPPEHPAIVELMGRVVEPWQRLQSAPVAPNAPNIGYASLFLLLDLLDWLRTYVEPVYQAIVGGGSPTGPNAAALLLGLTGQSVITLESSPRTRTMVEALADVKDSLGLLDGSSDTTPSTTFDLMRSALGAAWLSPAKEPAGLAGLALAAVQEIGDPYRVPPELSGLIKADPMTPRVTGSSGAGKPTGNQAYVIRMVLVHQPCRPLLSAPSRRFELARAMDSDAPARPVLLQLPDVNDLRSFNRGVAIEMPPSLRRLLDRVTPEMMKGDGLGSDPGLQLGMICSFSLQIIFLVAFIVMFIFLILLNIVFWWLPFLKICFPVPVRPTTTSGPTP
jgi:hypothetical protein